MPIDDELLDILVCPENHQPLRRAEADLLASVNERIRSGGVTNHSGGAVEKEIGEGLVREDGKCLYLVDDGIPNMLIDERVDL